MSFITHPRPSTVDRPDGPPVARRPRTGARSIDLRVVGGRTPIGRASVVLVDPTSVDGETSLDVLDDGDSTVVVVVLRRGATSTALHEYSTAEGISVDEAARRYLEQVGVRIRRRDRRIVTVIADGPGVIHELADVATAHGADRVVLPASVGHLERDAAARLARRVPADVQLATVSAPRSSRLSRDG